jgi:hypothetical protein
VLDASTEELPGSLYLTESSCRLDTSDGILPTALHTHKINVESTNHRELEAIEGKLLKV